MNRQWKRVREKKEFFMAAIADNGAGQKKKPDPELEQPQVTPVTKVKIV